MPHRVPRAAQVFINEQIESDFDRARRKAFLRRLRTLFRRGSNQLVPYHEVRTRVAPEAESYCGIQTVPLDKIVGSVDRFRDFDRAFLPRRRHSAGRWKSINRASYEEVRLPPVQLYQLSNVFFVIDGNHRVSVARAKGQEFIDAEVIEGRIRVPLDASMSPQELLLQAEYAEFLRRTDLDRLRPDHDIRPAALGRYDQLWDHILAHQEWFSRHEGRPVGTAEAVGLWYDGVYLPTVRAIRERKCRTPRSARTDADAYLWVVALRHAIDAAADGANRIGAGKHRASPGDVLYDRPNPFARRQFGGAHRRGAMNCEGSAAVQPIDEVPDERLNAA
jgi:hypothetical protein